MNNEFYDLDPNEENASRTSSNSCDTDRLSIGIDYSPYKALGESIKESIIKIHTIAHALQSTFEVILNATNAVVNTAYQIRQIITNIIPTNYFQEIITVWQEILNNPNSVINYTNYENKLDNFHWAWPFQFDTLSIKELIETVNSEKDFDKYMVKYFSAGKDKELITATENKLPKSQKLLFRQVATAYNNHDYAIANNALMSILDNLLSKYLENKGQTKRNGIFKPLVVLYSDISTSCLAAETFQLMMLSHNIDFIFQNFSFNEKITIDTNKKARRHPSVHGFKYSNKKVDTLMLINSLNELLSLQGFIKSFEGTLRFERNKVFFIDEAKQGKVLRPLMKEWILLILEEQNGLTNSQIIDMLGELGIRFPFVNSKYVSSILQDMRRVDRCIENKKVDGLTKWFSIPAVNE